MTIAYDPEAGPILRSGAEERDYLLKRAEDHGRRAETCVDDGTRMIHLRLERLYREQADLVTLVLPH